MKPPGTKRLKLNCDVLLLTSAFKFNLRCYIQGTGGVTLDVAVIASISTSSTATRIARVGDAATQSPINIPTSAAISVSATYSNANVQAGGQ